MRIRQGVANMRIRQGVADCVDELVSWCVNELMCWCVDVVVSWWVDELMSQQEKKKIDIPIFGEGKKWLFSRSRTVRKKNRYFNIYFFSLTVRNFYFFFPKRKLLFFFPYG